MAVEYAGGSLAIAHNGNLVNAESVRERLESRGAIFQSNSDTECLVHLVAQAKGADVVDRIVEALGVVSGAYSLLFMTEKKIIALRDPLGFRPLVLGKLGGAAVVASETCAFDLMGAEYVRDVEPGELVEIDESGIRSRRLGADTGGKRGFCVFELVYFARPDSVVEGRPVYDARKRMGQALAREHAVGADVVIAVPDSGVPAAIGYAQEAKVPFEVGLVRSHYVGRTFIEPQQSIRHFGVKLKLNAVREVLAGRRVVVVDDSIVRGTTSRKIIKMIRDAGAKEVHFRVSSPPTIGPCFYGIDTPDRGELIAANQSIEEIRKFLGCDTLGYLSREGMMRAVGGPAGYCDACFSLEYPVPVDGTRRAHPARIITNG
jgi:amidophosphoribosyltransferase